MEVLFVSCCRSDVVDRDVGDDLLLTVMETAMSSTARLGRKTTRDDELEHLRRALLKKPNSSSPDAGSQG